MLIYEIMQQRAQIYILWIGLYYKNYITDHYIVISSAVAILGRGRADRSGWHSPRGDTGLKFFCGLI